MIPAERQKRIISIIGNNQVVSISTLVETLHVSHMTIRRDIKALESAGQVVCVSGGVQLIERLISEPSHDTKTQQNIAEKRAIGLEAAKYVPMQGTVFLDAGTTTMEVARNIAQNEDLIIITNDFEIARYVMNEGKCNLIHTGGTASRRNYSCVGELTASFISKLSIDVAFISTSSWGAEGTTTPDESKLLVKRSIAKQSRFNILVTDSSKYGKVATFLINDLSAFDMIITDTNLRHKSRSLIDRKGIEVVIVDANQPDSEATTLSELGDEFDDLEPKNTKSKSKSSSKTLKPYDNHQHPDHEFLEGEDNLDEFYDDEDDFFDDEDY